MTLAPEQNQALVVRLTPNFPLVIGPGGVLLAGRHGHNDLACELPQLLLLERIGRGDPRSVPELVAEVVGLTDTDADALRNFADHLVFRGLLEPGGPGAPDLVAPAVLPAGDVAPTVADVEVVLPTPVIVGVGPAGFEKRNHAGDVEVLLSAVELEAATRFCQPKTVASAFKNHQKRAGSLALDEATYTALAAQLLGTQMLRAFDADDLGLGKGYNRLAEEQIRETYGRAAVGAAMDRAMARLDQVEQERRERTGLARTKVFPLHAIPTDWRNPPLSLGLLFSYAKVYEDGRLEESYDLRPDWMLDDERLEAYVDEPSIYLFSSYIWSSAENLRLSALIKERNPGNVTIHGGPNVPKYEADVLNYFADNPHVDITVRGEGEITAAEILDALAGKLGDGPVDLSVLDGVAGLSYRDGDRVIRTADRDRLTDLDVVPSPYLSGVFDSYVEGWNSIADTGAAGADGWAYKLPVVVLETNRGCPYGCTFCDWGSATNSRIRKYSIDRIFAEIQWCSRQQGRHHRAGRRQLRHLRARRRDHREGRQLQAGPGLPKQFGTNYAKNSVKHLKQIVEELARADILSFGLLSLQSMDADTLNTISRSNIKLEKYEELAAEFQRAHLPLYVDLMLGLPGPDAAVVPQRPAGVHQPGGPRQGLPDPAAGQQPDERAQLPRAARHREQAGRARGPVGLVHPRRVRRHAPDPPGVLPAREVRHAALRGPLRPGRDRPARDRPLRGHVAGRSRRAPPLADARLHPQRAAPLHGGAGELEGAARRGAPLSGRGRRPGRRRRARHGAHRAAHDAARPPPRVPVLGRAPPRLRGLVRGHDRGQARRPPRGLALARSPPCATSGPAPWSWRTTARSAPTRWAAAPTATPGTPGTSTRRSPGPSPSRADRGSPLRPGPELSLILSFVSVRGRVPSGGIMAVWEFAGGLARRGHEVHLMHTSQLGDRVESLADIGWFDFDDRIQHHFCDPHAFRPERSDFVFAIVGPPPPHLGLPLTWVQAVDAFPAYAERSIFGAPCPKLCTSSFLRDTAIAKGVDPRQAVHMPYGIKHDKYRITTPIDQRPPTVAMLHADAALKGSDTGLAAIVEARRRVPDLRAVLFGVAPRPDLPDWVDYVRDPPQEELVERIYNGSRIFVLPSVVEGFGLAAVESMASGCALASTACGGSSDYALHGDTALVSPPGDVEAMAEHLVTLLQVDDQRVEMAQRGAAFVQRFDWDRSAALLEAFLTDYAQDPDSRRQPEALLPWPD